MSLSKTIEMLQQFYHYSQYSLDNSSSLFIFSLDDSKNEQDEAIKKRYFARIPTLLQFNQMEERTFQKEALLFLLEKRKVRLDSVPVEIFGLDPLPDLDKINQIKERI